MLSSFVFINFISWKIFFMCFSIFFWLQISFSIFFTFSTFFTVKMYKMWEIVSDLWINGKTYGANSWLYLWLQNFKNRTSYNKHMLVCKKTKEGIKIKDKCGSCSEAIVLEELMKQFNRKLQQLKNHKCWNLLKFIVIITCDIFSTCFEKKVYKYKLTI